ncbi:MAG TPA: hypothetical protein VHE08_06710 [Solirubrobacterales bacterium]|nr:hypothetical protein [Solirubrobacterales bacterium]
MSKLKKLFSFSDAVALLALFFALGGTVYAATGKIDGAQIKPRSVPGNRLKAKAVGTAEIKKGAIGSAQIKAGSITAGKVRSGSLTAAQIDQTTLTGISAANLHAVQYVSVSVGLVKGASTGTSGTANCPTGMKVIGGGATTSNGTYASIFESAPSGDRNGWYAAGYAGTTGVDMTITAICTAVAAPTG